MHSAVKFIILFVICLLGISFVLLLTKDKSSVGGIWKPVSIVSKPTKGITDLKRTDGRTNILLLGMDKRSPGNTVTSTLTDTIMIISIDKDGKNPAVISIPRDLWLDQSVCKINAVYNFSRMNNKSASDPHDPAIKATIESVEYVSGLPIHYYALVGFDAFKDAVDAVGGITLNVDETFDDYEYPIEGKEDAIPESSRYMHVHFDAGVQKLDGEKALQYARSRHSTNPNENGDFARARRQQKVLMALKENVLSKETLFDVDNMSSLYDSYSKNVKSDISLPEILFAYKKYKDLEIGDVQRIVLSNETADPLKPGSGTLMVPSQEDREARYKGQYVLVPSDSTFDSIHALIRSKLFESQSDTKTLQNNN